MRNNFLSKMQHLLFVTLLLALTGCGANNLAGTADNGTPGSVTAKLQWAESGKSTAKTVAAVPVGVTKMRFTVTGAGIPVVRKDIDVSGGQTTGTIDGIYPGNVSLVVQALDSAGAVKYEGFALNVVVASSQTTDVGTISMTVPTVKAADASCLGCHETTIGVTGQNIIAEYKQSGHYTNISFTDANGVGTGCAGCHGPNHNTPDPSANGTSARCFDCHSANNATLVANHGTYYLANGTACAACHQSHNTAAANQERKDWAQSAHGATDFAGMNHNTGTCARCHNGKGLIAALAAPNATTTVTPGQQMITCDACHTDASLGKLRVLAGTKASAFAVYTTSTLGYQFAPNNNLNPKKKAYFPDVAASNICVVCHSGSREGSATTKAFSDPYFANFSSGKTIAPHNLPAAAVMYVKFGFTNLSTGTNGVPTQAYINSLTSDLDAAPGTSGVVTSTHRKLGTSAIHGDSHNPAKFVSGYLDTNGPCSACHLSGSHSLKIDAKAISTVCNTCHSAENTNPITDIGSFNTFFLEPQKEVYNNAIKLAVAILNKKVADTAVTGLNFYINNNGKFSIGNTVLKTDGTGNYNSYTGDLRSIARTFGYSQATGLLKAGDLGQQKFIGALSNLVFVSEDQGGFAHARTYVRRLIYDSIDFLDDGILNRSVGTTAIAYSNLATIGGIANQLNTPVKLYTKGTNAYNLGADGKISTPYSGTSESMLFLINWDRNTGAWKSPERM